MSFWIQVPDYAPNPQAFQKEAERIKELHMYDVLRADRWLVPMVWKQEFPLLTKSL